MQFIFFVFVILVLYYIFKNYKTEEFKNINLGRKEIFSGDLLNHEAGLLIALMSKVAKADGRVGELEAELLKHLFTDISSRFENSQEVKEKLKNLYNEEKDNFYNLKLICQRLYTLTKYDYERRLTYMDYLLNLAFIDGVFSKEEQEITQDIAQALEIKHKDYISLISKIENILKDRNKKESLSIEKAYQLLDLKESDDMETIKKTYRTLVKKHHPDILAGKGESKSSIDEATKKLQEINEAYELIKKVKGF